ncbi:MAG: Poly(ADP-ribose) polymerase catalytic domain protein [Firmicutes bacterium ADurb.Bin506]|nr:MAG: Poly(ADP-ribose) polymerase catalytic domain protein [Firmicutes bacterium ADurb.Bin506]
MTDVIYLVCATTGESSTSKHGNSNKMHKWTRRPDGQWDHTYGRVGTPGVTHTVSESKMQSKMAEALRNGYKQVEVAADVGSGTVNGPAVAKADVRQKAIDEIAGGDKDLAKFVGMLVDKNTREITTGTTLKLDTATGLFKTDGGIIVTRKVVDEARVLLGQIKKLVSLPGTKDQDQVACDYMMRIPTDIGRNRPTFRNVFPDKAAVDKQEQILDALLGSLDMLAKPAAKADEPKVEAKKVWSVTMTPTDATELKRITAKFHSTAQGMHAAVQAGLVPKRAWQLSISHMDEAFAADGAMITPQHELWHGTRVGNLLSIFARGLIIPPWADAGRMFGDGVYFAPSSSKALNYSYGYWGGGGRDATCYMLLNTVATGRDFTPSGPGSWKAAPTGYDSVWARSGKSGVQNDEVIVYRASQAKITRLIEFGAK